MTKEDFSETKDQNLTKAEPMWGGQIRVCEVKYLNGNTKFVVEKYDNALEQFSVIKPFPIMRQAAGGEAEASNQLRLTFLS